MLSILGYTNIMLAVFFVTSKCFFSSHFQNVLLVSPQMEPNASNALKAIMVSNATGNVLVIEMKGNLKHCTYAVICHNLG